MIEKSLGSAPKSTANLSNPEQVGNTELDIIEYYKNYPSIMQIKKILNIQTHLISRSYSQRYKFNYSIPKP